MSQPEEPTPGAPAEPVTPAEPTPGAPPAEPSNDGLPDDPQALKAEIARLRKENGSARTNAKTKAAEEARSALLREFAEKFGLASEEPPDPAVLSERMTSAQQEAASARLELDVWRRIARLGGDPEQLLDSRRFAEAIDAIEDDDFGAAADQVITDWLTRHPGMRPATTARPGRPVESLTPGALPNPGEPSLDEQIAVAKKAGDWRAVIGLQNQKLSN